MLSFEQIKAIEHALGPEKAGPTLDVFQTSDQRVMSALLGEVATKSDLANLWAEFKIDMGRLEARMVRLDTMLKLLIGLTALAVAFFSPVAEKLLALI